MDGYEQFPDKQEGQTDSDDSANNAKDDRQNIDWDRTFYGKTKIT